MPPSSRLSVSHLAFVTLLALLIGGECPASTIYLESDGVLALEADRIGVVPNEWRRVVNRDGSAYLEAQVDSFNTPGLGTISYPFLVSNSGDYQFAFRSRIGLGMSNTEHNDTWVRLLDASGQGVLSIPNDNVVSAGRWYKVYMNVRPDWSHNASNKDEDPHSLSWSLAAGQQYELQISSRSAGHQVDRLFLWDRERHNFANELRGNAASNSAFQALPNSAIVPEPSATAYAGAIALASATRRMKAPKLTRKS